MSIWIGIEKCSYIYIFFVCELNCRLRYLFWGLGEIEFVYDRVIYRGLELSFCRSIVFFF